MDDDIQSDEVIDIHCPLCGLISDNYFTEDVIESGIVIRSTAAYFMKL